MECQLGTCQAGIINICYAYKNTCIMHYRDFSRIVKLYDWGGGRVAYIFSMVNFNFESAIVFSGDTTSIYAVGVENL